ncbi:MAG: NFACT RNA binding domain-containing protein [Bacteroidota bacterium]
MIAHYFTLFHLAREWNERLHTWKIDEIFTQEKDELIFAFSLKEQQCFLIVSCAAHNVAYIREHYARAKKNSLDIFSQLTGQKIEKIFLHNNDRIIFLEVSSGKKIAIALFGAHANIYVVNEDNIIKECFTKSENAIEMPFTLISHNATDERIDAEHFLAQLALYLSDSIYFALKKTAPLLGTLLTKEICRRTHTDEKEIVSTIPIEKRKEIFVALQQMYQDNNTPAPRIYFEKNSVKEFALFPLQYFYGLEEKTFLSVNEAVQTFVALQRRSENFQRGHHSLLASVKNKLHRIQRSLIEIEKQLTETSRVEEYELNAQLLLANLQVVSKGMKEISLPLFENPASAIQISLDEKLTPVQNAERYFQKMKHAQRAYEELAKRKNNFLSIQRNIELLHTSLSSIQDSEALKKFMNEKEKELSALGIPLNKEKAEEERIPFRVFNVTGGYEVWAGKSSANNDELTIHNAKPNDLWFHARGAGGSHVVLRCHGKNPPSKQAINETASIAAYYSKMRKAKNVPVGYCERKYVRKPKGLKEGAVYMEREQVIFVQPKLPDGNKRE